MAREPGENEGNSMFPMMVNAIPDAIVAANLDQNVIFINRRAEELFQYTAVEVSQRPVTLLIPSFNLAAFPPGKQNLQERMEARRKDGSTFPVEANLSQGAGEEEGIFVLVLRDITDQKTVNETLTENEAKFRHVFESANVGKSITSVTGEISVNKAFADMLGYKPSELVHKTWQMLTPPEDVPALENKLSAIMKGENDSARFDKRYLHKNGSIVWADVHVSAQRDPTGKLLNFITTVVDISERKLAEQKLFESEERFRSIVEGSPDGFFIQVDSKFSYLNPAACRLFGINSPEELLGRAVIEQIHPDYHERVKERIRRLNQDRSSVNELLELRFLRMDGSEIWVETSGEPIHMDGKNGALVVVRDISRRKEVEKAREESEARFRLLAESAPVGIIITEKNLNILYVSPRVTEYFGYTHEDLPTALDWYRLAYPDEGYRSQVRRQWREAIQQAASDGTEIEPNIFPVTCKDGSTRMVEFRMKDTADLNFVILTDVSERIAAEQETKREQKILQLFIEHSPAAIAMLDRDMRYIAVSRRYLQDYGIQDQDVLGKSHYEVFPDIPERWKEIHRRTLTGSIESCEEDPFPRASGQLDWIRWEIRPWYENEGQIGGIILFSEVITERKKAKEALRNSEEKFSTLFEKTPVPAVLSRFPDFAFMDANDAWMNLFGFSKDEIIGKTSAELGIVRNLERRERAKNSVERHDPIRDLELALFTRDGRKIIALTNIDVVKIGGQEFALNTIYDITDRKNAEEALHRYNERLRNLHNIDQAILQAELVPEAIAAEAIQTLCNLVGCQQGGLGLLDQDGKKLLFSLIAGSEPKRRYLQDLTDSIRAELAQLADKKIEICEEISFEPFGVLSGIPEVRGDQASIRIALQSELGLVGFLYLGWPTPRTFAAEEVEIVNEVGQQIAIAIHQSNLGAALAAHAADLEVRVAERTAQLETSNKDLESFAYSVSHDLRAPLRSIAGFSQILEEDHGGKLDAEGRRLLGIIRSSTHKMDRLITDLLSLSRTGRTQMNIQLINMTGLVQTVYGEIAYPEGRKPCRFKLSALPEVHGDPTLLRQVWTNLISNAVKYTRPKEDCQIEVSGRRENGQCIYTIRDNGVGFDEEYKDHLFGLFQRLHRESEFEGTGVGLAIVQRIIQLHGGQVWAEGKVGVGASFHFSLPEKQESDSV
jgi:PAS domain S-box-containing protein